MALEGLTCTVVLESLSQPLLLFGIFDCSLGTDPEVSACNKSSITPGKVLFNPLNPATAGLRSASGGGIGDIRPWLLEWMGGKAAGLSPC